MRYRTITALSALALMTSPILAADTGTVLTGKDAFGDYKQDAPGVVRHITAGDIDPPNVTDSASNSPRNVPMPANPGLKVPDGFKIEMVASGIKNPRALRFAPDGDLFVANSGGGEVLVFHFPEAGGEPTKTTFASGLHYPYGIAFYPQDNPQYVYIAESNGLKRYAYKAGGTEATGQPEQILSDIPDNHHITRDVVFSPDGKTMFYSVGSGSNVGDGTMDKEPEGGKDAWISGHPLGVAWGREEGRAAVMAYDPDGKNGRYYATGLRNCAGMTLQPATGQPWCVVNERDALGDNVPFEYATQLKDGAFYGWPWYYIGGNEDPRWAGARPDLKDKVTVPDVLMQAHSAPLNIAFDTSDAWGADYKGDAFVALHGSWNRGTRTGYKVVRLDFDDAGKPTGTYEDFVTGFVMDDASVWGRPAGVAVAPNGDLYISEDGAGTIWRVSKAS